jgi:hypothetical protein
MLNKTLSICKKLDLAICVCTSDSYSDVWDLFYFFWNKHFFSDQIPVYFLTSKQSKKKNTPYNIIFPKRSISTDPWSNRMLECIEQINHENIITTTEDAIINKRIDINKFYHAINFFNNNNLDYLKMSPFYPNKSREKMNTFVSHSDWELHRVNLTKALWKKKSLMKILIKNETINDFDMFASLRASNQKLKIYHCDFTVLNYTEIIHGGKFNFRAKKFLDEIKYFEKYDRKFNNFYENLNIIYKYLKLYIYSTIPVKVKKKMIENNLIGNN